MTNVSRPIFGPLVWAAALAVLIGRIYITPRLVGVPGWEGSYEAVAHMVVGFMILVGIYDRHSVLGPARLLFWIGWILAGWELGWFLVQRYLAGI